MNFHCYLLCTKISFLGFWYIQRTRSQISTPTLTHTYYSMYNARTWQITAQFLFRSKTKTIFYKADWKVCNKNIHFIGSCTGENTVILSITTSFCLFQNHPFVNPVRKLTPEPWRCWVLYQSEQYCNFNRVLSAQPPLDASEKSPCQWLLQFVSNRASYLSPALLPSRDYFSLLMTTLC